MRPLVPTPRPSPLQASQLRSGSGRSNREDVCVLIWIESEPSVVSGPA